MPVVTNENINALEEILKRGKSLSISEFQELIKRENPALYRFFSRFVFNEKNNPESAINFLYGACIIYNALNRQASANKLEKEIEGK